MYPKSQRKSVNDEDDKVLGAGPCNNEVQNPLRRDKGGGQQWQCPCSLCSGAGPHYIFWTSRKVIRNSEEQQRRGKVE